MDLPWIKLFMDTRRTEADKIQADWSDQCHTPSEAEVKRAALLAWEGHLTSVKYMIIMNVSITDIPRDHMERLASVVTDTVNIHRINHADQLGSILGSVKCKELWLCDMELSEVETRALVTAMRDRVKCVRLWYYTLDIEELTQYDGQGHCSVLDVKDDMNTRYEKRHRRWAADKGWTVMILDDDWGGLVMERK